MREIYSEQEIKDLKSKRQHVRILWSTFFFFIILSCGGYYFLQKSGLIFNFVYACCLSLCECKIYSSITKITKQEDYIKYNIYLKERGKKLYANK